MSEKITDSDMAIENLLDLANALENDGEFYTDDIIVTIAAAEAIENRIAELEKTDRDTTNSCSQCEVYAKRIEELEAEKNKQHKQSDYWEAKAGEFFDDITRLKDLHNSLMSAKVAGDAEKLIERIKEYAENVEVNASVCMVYVEQEINAMVEPGSTEPEPSPKLFKPGEIDPNVKCHRCGGMGWIDEVSGIPRPCPECRGNVPKDSQ